MAAPDSKALFYEFVDRLNEGDFEGMQKIWSPDLRHHSRYGPMGAGEVAGLMAMFMAAFSDLRFDVEEVVAEGDILSARMTASFRHTGPFLGVEPDGGRISVSVMGMVRVADGQFVEHWNVMDELYLMRQLGLVPEHLLAVMSGR